jgi:MOSC domain-containing protein YiiM
MTFEGTVASIHIAPVASEPTVSVDEAHAVPGKGLEGDRYFSGNGSFSEKSGPDREITLIEIEAIQSLERDHNLNINPGDARRNIVTSGVPLNHLVGLDFNVGQVTLRGLRLCEPCAHLASLTQEKVLPGLVHRGGLLAQILTEGVIRPGDTIQPR